MEDEQQIAAQWQQPCPPPRIDAPLESLCAIEPRTAFSVEAQGDCLYITHPTLLHRKIAVTSQCDTLVFDSNDSMEHKMEGSHLCQYCIAHLRIGSQREQSLIASVLKKGSHAPSAKGQRNGFARRCFEFTDNEWQQFGIVYHLDVHLLYLFFHHLHPFLPFYRCITHPCRFLVGQAVHDEARGSLDNPGNDVTKVGMDFLVPLH